MCNSACVSVDNYSKNDDYLCSQRLWWLLSLHNHVIVRLPFPSAWMLNKAALQLLFRSSLQNLKLCHVLSLCFRGNFLLRHAQPCTLPHSSLSGLKWELMILWSRLPARYRAAEQTLLTWTCCAAPSNTDPQLQTLIRNSDVINCIAALIARGKTEDSSSVLPIQAINRITCWSVLLRNCLKSALETKCKARRTSTYRCVFYSNSVKILTKLPNLWVLFNKKQEPGID